MAKLDIEKYDDSEKARLVQNRWDSSSELWEVLGNVYEHNTAVYENRAEWLKWIPERRRRFEVQANRVFVNEEAVINSLIANPPGLNILPSRDGENAQEFARKLESYLKKKFVDLNTKEILRMGLRNLYFARLLVIKAFWNPTINDFDYRSIDPRKVRVGKYARKEQDTEFAIEEIEDNLCAVIERFPKKREVLMQKFGFTGEKGAEELYIKNPDVKYKEAWIQDYVIFKLEDIILDCIKNPYWDWDGILVTEEEEKQLAELEGEARRTEMQRIKLEQETRKAQPQPKENVLAQSPEASPEANPEGNIETTAETSTENYAEGEEKKESAESYQESPIGDSPTYRPYYFNYFDNPRKPYIFGTIFNNENRPIGRTDMITLAAPLQRGVDKRKMDIDENCELANGVLKVDASVMGKSDAQRIRFETKGIIWGKGVKDGVTRETGQALPEMVFNDMVDSRNEIDSIMAATSAFRGQREGTETKAGRLALIQQSYLRLNELTQLVDFVSQEIFAWGMQLAKTRYTEYHYAKWMGKDGAREVIELIQDDFETGSEITITAGKTLPVDDEFKFEQAQKDVEKGFISPVDYLEIAQYNNAKELAKNAVTYKINPVVSVGVTEEEMALLQPPQNEEKPPNVSINYADLSPDAQIQLLAKIGIQANPEIVFGEKMKQDAVKQKENDAKADAMKMKSESATTPPKK